MTETQSDYITDARELIGWDRPIEIQDDGDLRKYRIELPNLYDDSDLDPYEFRLLAHYKRVGNCTEGSNTTGRICKMSPAQVSVKRMSLRKKGFIRMQRVQLPKNQYSYRITVIDRWLENFNKYAKLIPPSPHDTPPSSHELKKVVVAVDTSKIFTAYSNEIGVITSMIADDIEAWIVEVNPDWIIPAIHEAATQNKRNWKYCAAILKRWKAQGFRDNDKPKAEDQPAQPRQKTELEIFMESQNAK